MNLVIRDIKRKDYNKAIQFSIKGMHFDWYLNSRFLLNLYGRFFWYSELNRATQVFAAYADNIFVGVLLAEFNGEKKKHCSFWEWLFAKIIDIMQNLFFKDGAGLYETTKDELLENYLKEHNPDGELLFLAADPDCKIKGIGTALLNALENVEKGKLIYLFTDDACTYQFYEHRGFERTQERDIVMELPKGEVPLKCFIYSKTL